ncbi:MAG: M50 family metallopeptidase [Candidatus Methanoperedens sp.]|nr:M50 family metallopeptidase [Candidatus Methanoperedens sp.]
MAKTREIVHLVASLIVLTIAFTYPSLSTERLIIVAFSVGTGFLLHELAHKFTAQKYGYAADYEASPMGLMLALGLSVITSGGFVFAAPGAVMIRSRQVFYSPLDDRYWDTQRSAKEFAYISVSGVVVNLVLAVSFFIASFFVTSGLAYALLRTGAFINVFLAGFNMIPFGPLDGAKVWRYNPVLWGLVGIPSIILFLIL